MASLAAKEVAQEVLATIGRGEFPVIEKIVVQKGYKKTTARAGLVQKTKSYLSIIEPFADRLIKHRERILQRMEETIDSAEYSDLSSSMDKITKVIQIITGGATENIAIGVKKLSDDDLANIATGGKD